MNTANSVTLDPAMLEKFNQFQEQKISEVPDSFDQFLKKGNPVTDSNMDEPESAPEGQNLSQESSSDSTNNTNCVQSPDQVFSSPVGQVSAFYNQSQPTEPDVEMEDMEFKPI